jgi:hypothetical protein
MRTLIIASSILVACLCITCQFEKAEEASVKNTVIKYLDAVENHEYDKNWHSNYGLKLFHPDANPFGLPIKYSTITEDIQSFSGLNVILDSSIQTIDKRLDRVDSIKPQTIREEAYFVKVRYSMIAFTKKGKLQILNEPIIAYEYIILAKDPHDSSYKVIDNFPDPRAQFFKINYFIENYDLIASVNENLGDKDEILTKLAAINKYDK